MKKIMSLMLGVSLVLGAASMFAQDTTTAGGTASTKTKKSRKSKKAKKSTDSSTMPSTDSTKK
ncbi:MAG: hypothetical protein M3Z32_10030 [Acidobacteriota bacterium]|nr:hypothetical protein [Acidobacteriota bacterium]